MEAIWNAGDKATLMHSVMHRLNSGSSPFIIRDILRAVD
jgi:hypothetical protein